MEMEAIKLMAHFRSDHKISDKNSKKYEMSLRAHYLGLTGEYAVAKAINGFKKESALVSPVNSLDLLPEDVDSVVVLLMARPDYPSRFSIAH